MDTILSAIASPIKSVVSDVENLVAPKTPLGYTPIVNRSPTIAQSTPPIVGAPKTIVPQSLPTNLKSVIGAPISPSVPKTSSITSIISKPINSIISDLPQINDSTPARTGTQAQELDAASKGQVLGSDVLAAVPGATVSTVKGIGQGLARTAASIGLLVKQTGNALTNFGGSSTLQSMSVPKWEQGILGTDKINSPAQDIDSMEQSIKNSPFAQKFGIDKDARSLAFAGVLGSDALQFGFGEDDASVQSARDAVISALAKSNSEEDILPILKSIKMNDGIASDLAPYLAQTSSKAEISDALDIAQTLQKGLSSLPDFEDVNPIKSDPETKIQSLGFHDYEEPTVDSETGQMRQDKTRPAQTGQDVTTAISRPISDVIGTAKFGDETVPIKRGGQVEIPQAKAPTLFDEPKSKPPVYEGEKDLTVKTLQKLEGRSTVSKTFIENLTNQPDLKQQERDIVRGVLKDYPAGSQVPVQEFANKVKAELLPLERKGSAGSVRSGDGGKEGFSSARYENITLPKEIRGEVQNYSENIYSSPIKTSAGHLHFSGRPDAENYFGHTRTEDMADGITRRVLENQTDLHQKGNLERENGGKNHIGLTDAERTKIQKEGGTIEERNSKTKTIQDARSKEFSKLNQYNDPTAHFRMVREEIKKAAEDGKTKLQFPTGETAMKIEGLAENNYWYKVNSENRAVTAKLSIEDLKIGLPVKGHGGDWIITDVLGDGKFKAIPKRQFGPGEISDLQEGKELHRDLLSYAETFDISGKVDTNNPIYRFYEKDLGRYLTNSFGAQRVTDARGVSWYEVPVSEKNLAPVQAFKTGLGKFNMPSEAAKALVRQYFSKDEVGILFSRDLGKNVLGRFDIDKFRNKVALLEKGNFVSGSTVYHELFHGLFRLRFTPEEQSAAINRIQSDPKLKTLIDVKYSQYPASERAEEYLADDFAKFKEGPKTYKGFFRSLWEKLLDYIRDIIRRGNDFEKLYDEAETRTAAVKSEPTTRLKVENADDISYPDNEKESSPEQATEKPTTAEKNSESETVPKQTEKTVQEDATQNESVPDSNVPLTESMGSSEKAVKDETRETSPDRTGQDETRQDKSASPLGRRDRTLISERGPDEAQMRPRTSTQEAANRQYLKNAKAEAEVNLPSKEVMKIRAKENDVKTVYSVADRTKAESALGQVINEMDASEKGSRTMIGSGPQRSFIATPSTFPKWVPEDLRSRALFDKVIGKTGALNDLHYPDRTVSLREAKLIDAIYNQIDERIGVNTSRLRQGITNAYTPEGRLQAKDTEATNKLLESEHRKTARMVHDEEAEKQREYRVKKADDEFQSKLKESDARIAEHEANVKRAIREANSKEGIMKGLARDLNPVAKLPASTKTIVEKWLADKEMAPLKAKEEFEKYPGHTKEGMNTIISQQDGAKIPYLTQAFENLHTEGRQRGLDIGHQENYQPQVWKQTPEEIHQIIAKRMEAQGVSKEEIKDYLDGQKKLDKPTATRLKLNPFFTREKVVPDYRTGIAMGLTPKYQNPVQLIAHYRQNMEVAVANRNLVDSLKHNGDLMSTDLNEKPRGFKETSVFGKSYFAPAHLADFLNDFLRSDDDLTWQQQLAHNIAITSRAIENIGLVTGIPGTTLQAFPIAMLQMEVLGRGNLKAIMPFLRSNSDVATAKWVEKNWSIIKQMTQDGITLGKLGEGEWSKKSVMGIIKDANLMSIKGAGALGGNIFNSLFQSKTFDRMIPMLSVDLYKGVYNKQIVKGVPEVVARKLASDTVKNMYVQRNPQGKTISESLRVAAYGPVWRQQIANMLYNVAKGYSTEFKNPAYSPNRKLLAGVLLTFIAYQMMQKKISGKFTWQNPEGHELDLAVPQSDGSNTYVTFFPSFMTVPRIIVGTANALGHGDVSDATSIASGLVNPILQTLASVITNKDYYDRPIYKPTDSAGTKYAKLAEYAAGESFEPAFLRSLIEYKDGTNTSLGTIAALTGGIIKYQTAASIASENNYNIKTAKTVALAKAKAPIQKIYDSNQILKASGKTDQANKIYDALSPGQKILYNQIKATEKTKATNARKPAIQEIYDANQVLKSTGKTAEANAIYSKLSVEDKHVYTLIKKAEEKDQKLGL